MHPMKPLQKRKRLNIATVAKFNTQNVATVAMFNTQNEATHMVNISQLGPPIFYIVSSVQLAQPVARL